jgi:hypothetical protein
MAVEGIGSVVQNLADQAYGQAPSAPGAPAAAVNAGKAPTAPPVAEDTFTPSAQNNPAQSAAQEAGIFQVTPGALTAATANLVSGQPIQSGAPASNVPAAGTPGGVPRTAAAAPGATTTAAANPSTQVKLQALNAALPALGLTNQEIQQIDRIATLVQDFNPGAYINLVNQYEAEAQTATQRTPAIVAVPPNSAALVNITADANPGGSQAQGVAVQSSGPQTNANSGAGNGGGPSAGTNNTQAGAPAGQPAPALAPPQNTSGNGKP